MQGDEHRGTLGTVRNATLLLSLLAEGPAYNQLTDLAERSGMSLPTVHRLLRSLALAGLVEQDPRSLRYGLGPEIVRLSERYLDRLPTLRALSPYLRELRDTTKTTILVALLVRTSIIYVDRVDGEEGAGVFRESHRVHQALDTAEEAYHSLFDGHVPDQPPRFAAFLGTVRMIVDQSADSASKETV